MPRSKKTSRPTGVEHANLAESQLYGLANYSFWWLFISSVIVVFGLYLPTLVLETSCSDLILSAPVCREALIFGTDPDGMEPVLLLGWLGYLIAAGDQILERRLGVVAMKSYENEMLKPAQIVSTFFSLIALVGLFTLFTDEEIPSLGIFVVILVGTLLAGLPMDDKQKRSNLKPLWAQFGYYLNNTIAGLLTISSLSAYIEVPWILSL